MSKRAVEDAIRRLNEAPTGPVIPEFHARALAQALDQEIARAAEVGWTRISLHMDLRDAMRLSQFLRRK